MILFRNLFHYINGSNMYSTSKRLRRLSQKRYQLKLLNSKAKIYESKFTKRMIKAILPLQSQGMQIPNTCRELGISIHKNF